MNTAELQCVLERATLFSNCRFLGVFAADRAPTRLSEDPRMYPCAYVVNTDKASLPGTHWITCFAASERSPVEFFDSYGLAPSAYPNVRLCRWRRRVRRISSTSLQSPRSTVCGHYCVYYICKRIAGQSPQQIMYNLLRFQRYGDPPFAQDRLVRRFVRNLCRQLPTRLCCLRSHSCSGSAQCCNARCRSTQ
jgi:hypothetical protein